MTAQLDRIISADLAALADDCRRAPISAYRDGTDGAARRRDALVAEQAPQWAAAVRGLAPVFAHRVARIVTGASALITAALTVLVFRDPAVVAEPGKTLPAILALHGVLYVAALDQGWRWFRRRMATAAAPLGDVDAQLAQLAVAPLARARAAVEHLAGASVTVALAGATTLAVALASVVLGAVHADAHGVPVREIDRVLGEGAMDLAIAVGLALAVAIGTVCQRVQRAGAVPDWLKPLTTPWITTLALIMVDFDLGGLAHPDPATGFTRIGFGLALVTMVLVCSLGVIGWRFRRELARIDAAGR